MISAMASSTTLRVLENGALNTAVPCSVAVVRSIWLVPMQNAPIASRSGAASSTALVTLVFERMPSSWNPGSAAASSASSRAPLTVSTSIPRSVSSRTPSGWMFSSSRAFMIPLASGVGAASV